jgi:uncharacterized protein (DUF433 family)
MNDDGVVLIANTRVTLDAIVEAHREGLTAEEIAEQYPSVSAVDIEQTIDHALKHPVEVNRYLVRRIAESERVRQENEARFSPIGIRARLLARTQQQDHP